VHATLDYWQSEGGFSLGELKDFYREEWDDAKESAE
jgi:hypothetical protein